MPALTEVLKMLTHVNTCTFVIPFFFDFVILFVCSCFMSNKYYLSKLMLLNFCGRKISFLYKQISLIAEELTQ